MHFQSTVTEDGVGSGRASRHEFVKSHECKCMYRCVSITQTFITRNPLLLGYYCYSRPVRAVGHFGYSRPVRVIETHLHTYWVSLTYQTKSGLVNPTNDVALCRRFRHRCTSCSNTIMCRNVPLNSTYVYSPLSSFAA